MEALKPIDLSNKNDQDIKALRIVSFEYLLAGISAEYMKIKEIKTTEQFNEMNSFNFTTLISYPFFVALSNGHASSLYSLFGDFYAFNFGPASLTLYNDLRIHDDPAARELKYFQLGFDSHSKGCQVRDEYKKLEFKEIQFLINAEMMMLKGESLRFADVEIESENKIKKSNPIPFAINSGIAAIKKQSGDTFFDGDNYSIMFQANYFGAFRKAVRANNPKKIEYRDIEDPSRRPFYMDSIFSNV